MSFNKRIIPDLDDLIKRRNEIGNDSLFLKEIIGKSDCIIGSEVSLNFIREMEKSLYSNKND